MTKTHALLAALLAAGCTLTLDPSQYAPKSASDCGPSQKVCGYKCVPKDDPATGCGGESCLPCAGGANAIATCGASNACALQCNLGFGDCVNGAADGCEAKLDTPGNCGACNRFCSTSVCDPSGFCPPSVMPGPGPATAIAADSSGTALPGAVYFVDPNGLAQFSFPTGTMSSHFGLTGVPGATVSCLGVGANSAFVCMEDHSPTAPRSYVYQVTPLPPSGAATYPRVDTGFPVGSPHGDGRIAVGPADHAWWIDGSGWFLFGLWEMAVGQTGMNGGPVGAWRAVAADPVTGEGYVADDADGGRIQRLANATTFNDNVTLVATGAGSVGAIAVWNVGPSAEVYWADLATGSVLRQRNGVRQTIFKGSGPTGRMRMAANAAGVYWIDRDARQAWAYLPGAVGLVPLMAGKSAVDVAAGPGWVFWLGADGTVYGIQP
jgi:hypothetical protein